ncbi:MAG TPA: glycosyltransferase [Patescibacteria group bacterium]|nr:glycosyltransferase [Patescibacteria group bacterium]
MKVLFLTRLFFPHVGGVERHISGLINTLSKKHKFTIITEQFSPDLPRHEVIKGVSIFRIPLANASEKHKKWLIWKWLLKNSYLIFSADIIHIHDVFFWILPFLLFTRNRIFITFHGYEGVNAPVWKQKFWHKLAERLTRGNICIGDFHKKWYGTRPDIVSYGAVDQISTPTTKRAGAIFIGRPTTDAGLEEYKKLAKIHKIKLDIHTHTPNAARLIPRYKYAFVSRYLAILEALITKTPVIVHYNNAIKYDYLALAPFAKFISQFNDYRLADVFSITPDKIQKGYKWAREQTWAKLAGEYETLWQK